MTFPNYNEKHKHQALFSAKDFMKYKKIDKKNLPKKYIITYQGVPLRFFKKKFNYKTIKLSSNLKIHKIGDIGFVKMTGIGSPHAVTFFEEMIALGGKEFINIGTVGGLIKEGVFVCSKAIRDEGTSHHYAKSGRYSHPDKSLTNKLISSLKKANINFDIAPNWTIDAPYRETKKEIEHYRKEGIATVDMEASALFVVAKLRKVKIASVFAVSDILGKKWDPKFHTLNLKKALNRLVDVSINCLKN